MTPMRPTMPTALTLLLDSGMALETIAGALGVSYYTVWRWHHKITHPHAIIEKQFYLLYGRKVRRLLAAHPQEVRP